MGEDGKDGTLMKNQQAEFWHWGFSLLLVVCVNTITNGSERGHHPTLRPFSKPVSNLKGVRVKDVPCIYD